LDLYIDRLQRKEDEAEDKPEVAAIKNVIENRKDDKRKGER